MMIRNSPLNIILTHRQLKGTQLDRILPISVEDNPHGYGNPMRYYNLCDVTVRLNDAMLLFVLSNP